MRRAGATRRVLHQLYVRCREDARRFAELVIECLRIEPQGVPGCPNYEYAVIGEPSRKYLWILSRTPKMDDALFAGITKRLADQGYDAWKLERMKQTE